VPDMTNPNTSCSEDHSSVLIMILPASKRSSGVRVFAALIARALGDQGQKPWVAEKPG
jgi:hypothetical protein